MNVDREITRAEKYSVRGKEEEQEDDGLAGGLAELVEDARREAGEDWSGDVGAKEGEAEE